MTGKGAGFAEWLGCDPAEAEAEFLRGCEAAREIDREYAEAAKAKQALLAKGGAQADAREIREVMLDCVRSEDATQDDFAVLALVNKVVAEDDDCRAQNRDNASKPRRGPHEALILQVAADLRAKHPGWSAARLAAAVLQHHDLKGKADLPAHSGLQRWPELKAPKTARK